MREIILIFAGAGLGGVSRHLVNVGCAKWCGPTFPVGTMAVNLSGSLIMGLAAGWLAFKAGEAWSQPMRLFLMTGVLGGYTTFSAFSLDAVLLWERGEIGSAAFYVIGSTALSILGLIGGLQLIRSLT